MNCILIEHDEIAFPDVERDQQRKAIKIPWSSPWSMWNAIRNSPYHGQNGWFHGRFARCYWIQKDRGNVFMRFTERTESGIENVNLFTFFDWINSISLPDRRDVWSSITVYKKDSSRVQEWYGNDPKLISIVAIDNHDDFKYKTMALTALRARFLTSGRKVTIETSIRDDVAGGYPSSSESTCHR
jgi:hypothetical protein